MSGKCCYLCHQLHKHLFDGDLPPLSYLTRTFLTISRDSVHVRIPDTHGRVRPRDTSPFGVPQEVLDKLANDLREKLTEPAQREAPLSSSHRLNPAVTRKKMEARTRKTLHLFHICSGIGLIVGSDGMDRNALLVHGRVWTLVSLGSIA